MNQLLVYSIILGAVVGTLGAILRWPLWVVIGTSIGLNILMQTLMTFS